jgi:hypothetical protein
MKRWKNMCDYGKIIDHKRERKEKLNRAFDCYLMFLRLMIDKMPLQKRGSHAKDKVSTN